MGIAKITIEQIDMDFGGTQFRQSDDEMRSWNLLPHEILSLILSNLVAREIVSFRAVCNWWKATPPPSGIMPPLVSSFDSQTPFLLFKTKQLFHQLFHPIYVFSNNQKVYELPRINVRASNCGWLLVMLGGSHIFFINPFTKEKVELPSVENFPGIPEFTFSSPPTSPDCSVFGFRGSCDGITIYAIKLGQLEWTSHKLDISPGFKVLSCNPILFEGQYYFLGKFGSLLIYNLKGNKSRWVDCNKSRWPILRTLCSDSRSYMVESKGRLLLVFHNVETEGVSVFRLDLTSTRIWEKIDNLGGTMLFVSEAASFSVESVMKGPGNKIYFPRLVGNKVMFFSLDSHRYHCFDGDRSWKNMNEATSYPHSTWIMPCLSSDCNLDNSCGFSSQRHLQLKQNKHNSSDIGN